MAVRSIAVCTQKGGVGKTTAVANLAAAWGARGQRVLAIDADPQFALTRRFGVDPAERVTLYETLASRLVRGHAEIDVGEAIVDVLPGVALIPARRELADVEVTLAGITRRERLLRRVLARLPDVFDLVLIDCPPNLGLLTVNALCAADEVLIPIDMKSVDALAGAEELVATAAALEEDAPRVTALVRNRVDGTPRRRRTVYRAIAAALEELDLPLANTEIPARDDFEKSAIVHVPLVAWRPDHLGAHAFRRLATELDEAAA
jgi:chromosome partitioning protein